MGVTAGTDHLFAHHAMAGVPIHPQCLLVGRGIKARPARARIVLGAGIKERLAAAAATINPLAFLLLILAGKRPLGALLAAHLENVLG